MIAVVLLAFAGTQSSSGSGLFTDQRTPHAQQSNKRAAQKSQANAQQNRAGQKKKKAAGLVPPGPGLHLAFDVRPRDYRRTDRYVLEITHPSGEVTVHALQKPPLHKRSILVPLPALPAGKYTLVVIAEIEKRPLRSKPLSIDIPSSGH